MLHQALTLLIKHIYNMFAYIKLLTQTFFARSPPLQLVMYTKQDQQWSKHRTIMEPRLPLPFTPDTSYFTTIICFLCVRYTQHLSSIFPILAVCFSNLFISLYEDSITNVIAIKICPSICLLPYFGNCRRMQLDSRRMPCPLSNHALGQVVSPFMSQ